MLELGRRQGFDNFINRKQIWPFLLELDSKKLKDTPVFEWKGGLSRNSFDFEQLQKDAERSLSSMKTFESITKFHLYPLPYAARRSKRQCWPCWTASSPRTPN